MSALMTSLFVVFLLFANAVKCDVDEDDDDFRFVGLYAVIGRFWDLHFLEPVRCHNFSWGR